MGNQSLTPRQIVAELDKYIVGQKQAKKSVAVALRNRYRRSLLAEELRDEVVPKNILMIGPTGVGKTEIAHAARQACKCPVHQSRGYQVYRGWLCGARCGIHGP